MNSPENDPLKTRPTLLDKIRNLENEEAWLEFVNIYRPLIVRFGISRGANAADAEDIAQKTLAWVVERIKDFEYRPKNCPFRAWLLQKVQYLIFDRFRELHRTSGSFSSESDAPPPHPLPVLEQVPDPKSLEWEEQWEKEHQRALLDAASQIVRRRASPKNYQAYELYQVQGLSPEVVAQKLGVTADYVHLAAHRIRTRLKAEIERLRKTYDEPV